MPKENVDVQIEGGKATAAPPLGPALGPLGVNIGQVVSDINKATESLKGMQVPVTVVVDTDTKEYEVQVGTPPASALIKNELGIQKGAHDASSEKVGDLSMDQVIEIARMKEKSLLGRDFKHRVTDIIGACRSMGVTIDGKPPSQVTQMVKDGQYDEKLA